MDQKGNNHLKWTLQCVASKGEFQFKLMVHSREEATEWIQTLK